MYKFLLILKYLRKRRIAWVSLIAVMLCTTMVLVVISVMGGWLRMFRESFNGLSGDVIVQGESLTGFPYYQEMIQRIEQLPEVAAAAPLVRTFGLINVGNQIRKGVEVIGYPRDIVKVNEFGNSLFLNKGTRDLTFALRDDIEYNLPRNFRGKPAREWDGMIVGAGVIGLKKDPEGNVERPSIMYDIPVTLTVLPIDPESSNVDPTGKKQRFYWIVDDSRTKVFLYDSNSVYVAFDKLQQDLDMQGDADTPARCNDIQVKLKPGVDPDAASLRIDQVVQKVVQDRGIGFRYPIKVQTWEEMHRTFIGAVEKEKVLVTFLFAVISVVAIFLIFCIFYMIVVEKTRDIGIIKSVGATSRGVAGIFLGYGLAIGVVGGAMGLLFGWLIVHYINQLHDWLGRAMGVQVWNPEVYLFDKIPNTMNPPEVIVIVSIAIISSVLGALVPAWRAATLHPVEALRWE